MARFRFLLPTFLLLGMFLRPASAQDTPPPEPVAEPSTNKVAGTISVIDAETRELRPGDTFRYRIAEDPTIGNEPMRVTVTATGSAHFNVSRRYDTYVTVDTRGRKLAELRSEVKRLLEETYYQTATIDLDLDNVERGPASLANLAKVQVFGEMQGVFPLSESGATMLSDIILQLPRNDFANLEKVQVQRVESEGANPTRITVNVESILKGNDRSRDLELKDGDRIFIPARRILF